MQVKCDDSFETDYLANFIPKVVVLISVMHLNEVKKPSFADNNVPCY